MKILHLENITNIPYTTCTMLRKNGINCELLFAESAPHAHPLWDKVKVHAGDNVVKSSGERKRFDYYGDAALLPSWIERKEENKLVRFWLLKKILSSQCDIIHCYSKMGLEAAMLSGRPYLFQPMGIDSWYSSLFFEDVFVSFALKRAAIIASYTYDVEERLEQRGVGFVRLNIPMDVDEWSPQNIVSYISDTDFKKIGFPCFDKDVITILAPARQHWSMKGQDILLGYLQTAIGKGLKVHLIFAEWGFDVDRTKELANTLEISSSISFIPYVSNKMLAYLMLKSTAVIDCLTYGGLGVIGRMAVAMGKPLLNKTEINWEGYYANKPPYFAVEGEADFIQSLEYISDMNRDEYSEQSINWLKSELGFPEMSKKYIQLYESI